MAASGLREAFQVGVSILNTIVDKTTSTILAMTGDARAPQADTSEAEWWQHIGFLSRPSNPTVGNTDAQGICGEGLVMRRGDRDIVYASRDVRGQDMQGNMAPGETIVYAGGATGTAQGRVLLKADGSVALLTTDSNTATGKVVTLRMSPSELRFAAPWGSLVFDASGLHIKTKSGPTRLDMGGITIAGLPSALTTPLSSYITLTAGVIKNAAASVFNGAGSTFMPAVAAIGLPIIPPGAGPMNATQLAAINTFALAVSAAFTTSAAPSAGAAATATAAAATVLASALAAAPQPVQSQTVWNAP